MRSETLKRWSNQLKTLSPPIKHCKICLKPIKNPILFEFLTGRNVLCNQCTKLLEPQFKRFDIDGYEGTAIYDYNDNIRSLLYQFKGCYDYELFPIFIDRYSMEFKAIYYNYVMVPAPSYHIEDEQREFNHVVEMFKVINLPMLRIIHKNHPFKQAEHTKKGRKDITKFLSITDIEKIKGKNVLIVDDVLTTGSTVRAMIRLIQKGQPKNIKILVMSKREAHVS